MRKYIEDVLDKTFGQDIWTKIYLDKILVSYQHTENRKKSKKERVLDEFAAYVENNPGVSYTSAPLHIMQSTKIPW